MGTQISKSAGLLDQLVARRELQTKLRRQFAKKMQTENEKIDAAKAAIAKEASKLATYNKKSIISSREIQTAVRLIFQGELANHAVAEGTKAVMMYTCSTNAY